MGGLERLEPFLGDWTVATALPGAGLTGRMTCGWLLGGRYLVMRSEAPDPVPDSFTLVEANDETGGYIQHYFDSRGVTRVYAMTFDGRAWTLHRGSADFSPLPFHQRFLGEFSDDGQTIRGRWEQSPDGTEWELDFELTYTRAASD